MNRSLTATSSATLIALLFTTTGCQTYFYAHTVLHSNGSIERTIYQPNSDTPDSAQAPGSWDKIQSASKFSSGDGALRALPKDDDSHFVASGEFESLDQLPDHYQFPVNHPKASRLERSYTQTDLVLVTEHLWQEELTESVDLAAGREVAKDLIRFGAEHIVAILTERFGHDYDFSAIPKWADDEGTIWIIECYDALIEAAFQPEAERESFLRKRYASICQSHGLVFKDSNGRTMADDDFELADPMVEQQWLAFLETKIRSLIRRRDGRPLPQQFVDEILAEFQDNDGEGQDNGQPPTQLSEAADRVLKARYGGRKGFDKFLEEQIQAKLVTMLGVHLTNIGAQSFYYSMRMPGTIVETNGQLVSDQDVEWQFDADSAFPFGKTMSCRSLEANAESQKRLLGKEVLDNHASLATYRELLRDPELLAVMQTCASENSIEPLSVLKGDTANRLRTLLGVEEK